MDSLSLLSCASCKLCYWFQTIFSKKNFPDHSSCLPLVGATDRNAPKYILLVKSVLQCLNVLEEPQFYFSGKSIHFYLCLSGCFKGTVQTKINCYHLLTFMSNWCDFHATQGSCSALFHVMKIYGNHSCSLFPYISIVRRKSS